VRPGIRRDTLWILAAALTLAPMLVSAGDAGANVIDLQRDWEVIRYQTPDSERERRYQALAERAHAITEAHPGQPESMIWEGVVLTSLMGEKSAFTSFVPARQARAILERALPVDDRLLAAAGYEALGVLYYRAPRWPLGFRDADKARDFLLRALEIDPNGVDSNFLYGEFLVSIRHPDDAVSYLERSLAAPVRAGHQVADSGRHEEARALLGKTRPD
jgi:tetratricopeptide (TPR) repeat protein